MQGIGSRTRRTAARSRADFETLADGSHLLVGRDISDLD